MKTTPIDMRTLAVLTLACTMAAPLSLAEVINPIEDGVFDDSNTSYFLWLGGSSVNLRRVASLQRSSVTSHMVFEFPIANLEPGPRKLQFTLAGKPSGNTGDLTAVAKTHRFNIRIKPGDGVLTFADFLPIPPEVDAKYMGNGSIPFTELSPFMDTVPRSILWETLGYSQPAPLTYEVDQQDVGSVVASESPLFSQILDGLILDGHTHATVVVRFTNHWMTEIATLENNLFPPAQIVDLPEPTTLTGLCLGTLLLFRRRHTG